MPKVKSKKMNNKSKKVVLKNTVKKGGLKKSNKKQLKVILISSIALMLTLFFGYRLISGNWLGADAEAPYNYNAYYEKCNPAIRDVANFKIAEGAVDSNQATENGQCVKAIQRALNDCCGGGLVEDGRFGPLTKQAITNFQNFFKDPSPDGVVDKDFWNGLDYVHSVQLANKNNKPWKIPSEIWQEALARRTATPAPAPTTPTTPAQAPITTAPTTPTIPAQAPITTGTQDTQKPTKPSNFTATVDGNSDSNKFIKLKWDSSTDNVGISRYVVYRTNQGYELEVKSTVGTTITITKNDNISPGINYSFHVVAFDASGNRSDKSASKTIKLPAPPPAIIAVPVVESPNAPKCSPGERLDGGICVPIPINGCTTTTAEPSAHYKVVLARNGCVSKYNEDLLVKCFSGYKLEGTFVNNCVNVQINNIGSSTINSWRLYQSVQYKGNVSACPLLTYRNAQTNACHRGQKTGSLKGDSFTEVVYCNKQNYKPFSKKTGIRTEYKCMKS